MIENIRVFLQKFSTSELKQRGILQEKERNLLRHDSIKPLIGLMKEHNIDRLEYPDKNWFFDINGNFKNSSSPTDKEGNIKNLDNPGNIFQGMNPTINPHYKNKTVGRHSQKEDFETAPPQRIDVLFDQELYLIQKKKQIILYGTPGTGKTYSTKELAVKILGGDLDAIGDEYEKYRNEGRIEFITFHPSYSYEEFIEGITVVTKGENVPTENLQYVCKSGIFKNMCKRALGKAIDSSDEKLDGKKWIDVFKEYETLEDEIDFSDAPEHVMIIDEINRGDIAKILGELITLLEADKRLGEDNELIAKLPTSGDEFCVPPNLYIIGTMNTADRSIALLDVALRRRFGFIEMNPNLDLIEEHINENSEDIEEDARWLLVKSIAAVKKINIEISKDKAIGRDKQIGHSFLFKVHTIDDLILVWRYEILPLLEEYCYGDYLKINQIVFGKDTAWISQTEGIRKIDSTNIENMLDEIIKNEH